MIFQKAVNYRQKADNRRGSLLILVMWVLFFITVFTQAVGFAVRQKLRFVQRLDSREQLRYTAEAGVKKAMSILSRDNRTYDALRDRWSSNAAAFQSVKLMNAVFSVFFREQDITHYGIVDEERKININGSSSLILKRLIREVLQVSEEEAFDLSAAILDWEDGEDDTRAGGAESDYYQTLSPHYRAKNAPFDSLTELWLVKGMTPERYRALLPYVTIEGDGRVNLNTASAPVLHALGFSESLAGELIAFRNGPDAAAGTGDDLVFTDLSNAVTDLNRFGALSDTDRQSFQDFVESGSFSVYSTHFKIRSVSQMLRKQEALEIECVVDRTGNIFQWQEQFGNAFSFLPQPDSI